jgi:hypothetical protein
MLTDGVTVGLWRTATREARTLAARNDCIQ